MNGKTVDYLLPASDTGSFGHYTQTGNQITISSDISFTISEDGKTLIDGVSKTVYTLK